MNSSASAGVARSTTRGATPGIERLLPARRTGQPPPANYLVAVSVASPADNRTRSSSQLPGSGCSSLSSISDWTVFPSRIASMMSGASSGRRRILRSAGTSASRARRLPLGLLPDGKHQFLVPPVGILRETGTLYPYDAEALAGGRLHHHPALQVVHHLGA
jgi:hypothetical protein